MFFMTSMILTASLLQMRRYFLKLMNGMGKIEKKISDLSFTLFNSLGNSIFFFRGQRGILCRYL